MVDSGPVQMKNILQQSNSKPWEFSQLSCFNCLNLKDHKFYAFYIQSIFTML